MLFAFVFRGGMTREGDLEQYFVSFRGVNSCAKSAFSYTFPTPIYGGHLKADWLEIAGRLAHTTCGDAVEVTFEDGERKPERVELEDRDWRSESELVDWLQAGLEEWMTFELKEEEWLEIELRARIREVRFSRNLSAILGFNPSDSLPCRPRRIHKARCDLSAPLRYVALVSPHLVSNFAHQLANSAILASTQLHCHPTSRNLSSGPLLQAPRLSLPSSRLASLSLSLVSLTAAGAPVCIQPADIFVTFSHAPIDRIT